MSTPDYNSPVKFSLHLEGANLIDSFDLRAMATIVSEFTNIIDHTYCALSGKDRLSRDERKNLSIIATNIERASIHFDAELVVNSMQVVAPFIGLANPYTIWQYTVHSFNFLKYLCHKAKNNVKPTIIPNNSLGFAVNYGDNNTVTVNSTILAILPKSLGNLDNIANAMEDNNISSLKACSDVTPTSSIEVSASDKGFYKPPTFLNPNSVTLRVHIIRLDKNTLNGKLFVFPDQDIPEGEYSFSVIGKQDKLLYIRSYPQDEVTINALVEYKLYEIKGSQVHGLQIINIDPAK
ncbi:MAG: hypothetical protein LBL34_01340 [Clostridiales bacterium]|jgi:hypothetical protein|nr:hypothetical protein [Clostridiales bacterium]